MKLTSENFELLQRVYNSPQGKLMTSGTLPDGARELEAGGYMQIVITEAGQVAEELARIAASDADVSNAVARAECTVDAHVVGLGAEIPAKRREIRRMFGDMPSSRTPAGEKIVTWLESKI